jgi:hypothetical protein
VRAFRGRYFERPCERFNGQIRVFLEAESAYRGHECYSVVSTFRDDTTLGAKKCACKGHECACKALEEALRMAIEVVRVC